MTEQTCRTCTYHMSGNPPACNALHTPTDGTIECADWRVKEPSASDWRRDWSSYIPGQYGRQIGDAIESQAHRLPSHLHHQWRHDPSLLPCFFRQASRFINIPHPEYWETDQLFQTWETDQLFQISEGTITAAELQLREREAFIREAQRELQLRDREAFIREAQRLQATARPIQPSPISLSELRRATEDCPPPRLPGVRWSCAVYQHQEYCPGLSFDPNAPDLSVKTLDFVTIETPNGVRWSFQGTVILD